MRGSPAEPRILNKEMFWGFGIIIHSASRLEFPEILKGFVEKDLYKSKESRAYSYKARY